MHPKGNRRERLHLVCIGCNKSFPVSPSQSSRKWCTAKCRYATPGWSAVLHAGHVRVTACATCGKTFSSRLSQIGKYCTRKCLGIANGNRQSGSGDPSKYKTYTCAECQSDFTAWASVAHRRKYCSVGCRTRARNRRFRISRPTKIEVSLREGLRVVGIQAVPEYAIGRYNVDLAVPSRMLAIEADGRYWHSLPKQIIADQRKDATLAAEGWTIIRFGEDRITSDLSGCVAEVLSALGR